MKSLPPHPKKGAPAKRRNVIIACVCLCALVLAIRFFGSGSGGGSSRAVTRAYAQVRRAGARPARRRIAGRQRQ